MINKLLYHGSDKNLSVLEPLGIDMGMKFQKPKWAVFFWEDFNTALLWAIFQYLRRNKIVKTMYHVPTGKAIVDTTLRRDCSKAIGAAVYVYSKKLRLGQYRYGSSPDIREYTVDSTIMPDTKHEVELTEKLLEDSVLFMSKDVISLYKKELESGTYSNSRGIVFSLLMDRKRDFLRHKYMELMEAGELNYGDDLSKISLESLPLSSSW